MMVLVVISTLFVAASAAPSSSHPHIVFLLTDDLGYNAPGYRNRDLHTPALDALAADGLKLEEYCECYNAASPLPTSSPRRSHPPFLLADVYMYCAPTRGAFHTGRFPMHLDAVQKNLIPWSMPAGIDLRYEFLPAVLKKAGYQTHHIGKLPPSPSANNTVRTPLTATRAYVVVVGTALARQANGIKVFFTRTTRRSGGATTRRLASWSGARTITARTHRGR